MPPSTNPDHIESKDIAQFEILSVIARGGMGIVYKARNTALAQTVAIKMLQPATAMDYKTIERFKREANVLANLNHPNIVHLMNFGFSKITQPYMVLEYIEGPTLPEYLASSQTPSLEELRTIFIDVSSALAYAHEYGVLHRDLKPSNIMLKASGDGKYIAKVIDFGISKLLRDSEEGALTKTGEVIGTVAYMSPEQIGGTALDERTDIYSLGCVLFEALTGVTPFAAENHVDMIFQQLNAPVPTLASKRNRRFSYELEALVGKCLDKDPAKRFRTMNEFQNELRRIPLQIPRAVEKHLTRKKLLLGVSLMFVLIAFNLIAWMLLFRRSDSSDPQVTNEARKAKARNEGVLAVGEITAEQVAAEVIDRERDRETMNLKDSIDDAALAEFAKGKFATRQILFESAYVKGPGLAYLIHLPNLQRLAFQRSALTDRGLVEIGHMKNLRYLNLDSTRVTETGLSHLLECPLTEISLKAIGLTDAGLATVCKIKTLEDVWLEDNPKLTAKGFAYLQSLPRLESTSLRRMKTTDATIKALSEISTLRRLFLFDTNTTNEQVKILCEHANFKELILESQEDITDECIRDINKQKNLVKLDFKWTPAIKGTGFMYLTDLKKLAELGIEDTGVNDSAVQYINQMRPRFIKMGGSKISDKGLMQLAANKNLKKLEIVGEKTGTSIITFEAVRAFQKLRPDVDVAFADSTHSGEAIRSIRKVYNLPNDSRSNVRLRR